MRSIKIYDIFTTGRIPSWWVNFTDNVPTSDSVPTIAEIKTTLAECNAKYRMGRDGGRYLDFKTKRDLMMFLLRFQ